MVAFNVDNKIKTRILVVEDSQSLNYFYSAVVKTLDTEVKSAFNGKEAIELIQSFAPDIILLDLNLPDIPGMEILKLLQLQEHRVTSIVITADERIDLPAKAMKLGAYDFLTKPVDSNRLITTVNNTIEKLELEAIKEGRKKETPIKLGNFIGASQVMHDIYDKLCRISNSKASVFITGESGTGKEITANTLHELNTERKGKFIAINCAAIPKDIMESIIFGHIKGAFTGAISDRKGAVAEADGGTLFLDEICEMDLELQSKLLRFIQSGVYRMVGSTKTYTVDVRIICATNRDPLNEVKGGRFREDLFYRLFVIPIHLPPLRERDHDVVHIAMYFLKQYTEIEHKNFLYISHAATEILLQYPWPGNVRELQNAIHSTIVLNEGPVLEKDMLPPNILNAVADIRNNPANYQKYVGMNTIYSLYSNNASSPAAGEKSENSQSTQIPATSEVFHKPRPDDGKEDSGHHEDSDYPARHNFIPLPEIPADILSLEDIKRRYILAAVNSCNGSITKAAGLLRVNSSTIYRQIEKWESSGLIEKKSTFKTV